MFIRVKQVSKKTKAGVKRYRYYYLVKSYRQGSRVRQRMLCYLGKKPVISKSQIRDLSFVVDPEELMRVTRVKGLKIAAL